MHRHPTQQVILYLPVIHAGYEKFLQDHASANEVLILGRSFRELFPQLKKDIRALDPDTVMDMARLIVPRTHLRVVEIESFRDFVFGQQIVMPDEDICRQLESHFNLGHERKISYAPVFLRWDRSRAEAEKEVSADEVVSQDELHLRLASLASASSQNSQDWWRQVGAVAWKDGKVLYTDHNRHLPSDYTAAIEGDPRGNYRGGVRTDLSFALHAEAGIIGRAAREGVSLDGAGLSVNTFPCPACARLIMAAGFSEIVYQTGYVLLDGDDLLRQAGVKLTRVLPN